MRVEHLTSQLGGFICHLAAQFGQHSVCPQAGKLWRKSHPEVLQQQESFVAPRARTCCRERQTVEADQAWHRVREDPFWTWLGKAGGTGSSFCPAQHCLCPLPSLVVQLWWLSIVPSRLLPQTSFALHVPWAQMLLERSLWRWSFSFEVWVSAS